MSHIIGVSQRAPPSYHSYEKIAVLAYVCMYVCVYVAIRRPRAHHDLRMHAHSASCVSKDGQRRPRVH